MADSDGMPPLIGSLWRVCKEHRSAIIRLSGISLVIVAGILVYFGKFWLSIGRVTLAAWERHTDTNIIAPISLAAFAIFCWIIRWAFFGGTVTMKNWKRVIEWLLRQGQKWGFIVCAAWVMLFLCYTFLIAPPLVYQAKVYELKQLSETYKWETNRIAQLEKDWKHILETNKTFTLDMLETNKALTLDVLWKSKTLAQWRDMFSQTPDFIQNPKCPVRKPDDIWADFAAKQFRDNEPESACLIYALWINKYSERENTAVVVHWPVYHCSILFTNKPITRGTITVFDRSITDWESRISGIVANNVKDPRNTTNVLMQAIDKLRDVESRLEDRSRREPLCTNSLELIRGKIISVTTFNAMAVTNK